jgi:hypothetical protein
MNKIADPEWDSLLSALSARFHDAGIDITGGRKRARTKYILWKT